MIITYKGHKHLLFENGCDLSIFNGFGSYSENHFNLKARDKIFICTKDCEIAILKDGVFVTKKILGSSENVMGYVDKIVLKEIIKKVRNYKEENNE